MAKPKAAPVPVLTWTNTRVKLTDLQPWELNPRQSTKKQAERLLASWDEFGQVQTVAIGPGNEVYDGHQRLSALLTIHGNGYEIDARRASRPLTDQERRKLVAILHAGAVGSWDWDALSAWDAGDLMEWGFDGDALRAWNLDALNLREMIEEEGGTDPSQEWEGMPEFESEDLSAMKSIVVHFASLGDIEAFSKLVGQNITDKTKSIWYPKAEIRRFMDKRYVED